MSNDDDDQGVAPFPFAPPPPAGPVDGALDLGRAPDVQRLQPPSADAQRLQPGTHHDAQRLGRDSVDAQRSPSNIDAQRSQSNIDVQRADPGSQPADVQRAASDVQRGRRAGRARSFRHLRPRTRFLIASAAAVAAAGSTVLIVNAQDDDTPVAAPTTTAVVVVETTDPPSTEAPTTEPATVSIATAAPTTAADTTVVETTVVETTVVETTLVPTTLAVSEAGLYTVTVSDSVLSSSVTGTITLAQQPADVWKLEGPCDGIGTCTMSLASAAIGGGGTPAGAITIVVMSPSGPGTYAGSQDLTEALAAEGGESCGNASAEFNVTFGPGAFSGTYLATFSGAGDCPPFTVSANYAGTVNA